MFKTAAEHHAPRLFFMSLGAGGGDQGRGTFRSVVPPERIARTFPAFPTAENRRKWRIILFCQGFINETRFLRFFITKTV